MDKSLSNKLKKDYYNRVHNKIVRQLKERGITTNPKSVALIRNLYFSSNPPMTETRMIEFIAEKLAEFKANKNTRAWYYETALALLQIIEKDNYPILFKVKRYDPSKDPHAKKALSDS